MFYKKKYTEAEIIAGCVANDRHFQEVLYRQNFAKMMSMCLRYTSDKEEAMSILNNGFLRVFQKIDKYGFKGSFEGWMRRIIFHALSDYFRKKNRKPVHFLEVEDRDVPLTTTALDGLYVEDLMKMVDLLPPATKEVFTLYAIEGYTHVEISKKIKISEGTSKWHLSSARKKLKELLSEEQSQQSQRSNAKRVMKG